MKIAKVETLHCDGGWRPWTFVRIETDDGLVMGLRHRELMVEGVQFHPESVLTHGGHDLVQRFIDRAVSASAASA